ncbi:MAG: nascent polypeptide-associated complex protein [Candidatus Aenigmarchaeota archaeon]|nr:nascent polypeptide-associated complex protein [Candidatus Aenigmarchaeota archaeon]
MGFGRMNDKKLQEAMKKLNLNVREVNAEEVIIKCKDRNIIISKPEIMIADMLGKEVYQITGEISESASSSETDIKLVMEKTGKDRETVVRKLEELDNDLAKAIMELTED